jgi:NAD(P)H-hydrate epimerase
MLGGKAAEPVLVLCGPGNNGGDGLVIARTLFNRGVAARVVFVGPRERLEAGGDDVRLEARLWRALGQEIELVERANQLGSVRERLARAPLVVDALFGTGLARPLGEPYLSAIAAVNAAGRPVLAVDLPSGLDADSGEVLGAAVRATATVTFVARKPGLARGHGPKLCGRVVVAEIGIPRTLLEEALRDA